jgi:hypothetical protein
MAEGHFTIPSRIYLTLVQRAKLYHLLDHEGRDLDDWLTELATIYLDALPEPPAVEATAVGDASTEELRRRRSELRRLRPRLNDPHNPPPPWLVQMVADLEAEIHRLEGAAGGS